MVEATAEIQGWMSEVELEFLAKMVREAGPNDLIVELGAWKGRSTAALYGAMHHNQAVVTVDTWLGQADIRFDAHSDVIKGDVFLEFLDNMKGLGFNPQWYQPGSTGPCYLRMFARDAAALFEEGQIKRFFLDCDHTQIGGDLDTWMEKVDPDGTLCGHDFAWVGAKDIIQKRVVVDQVIGDIWVAGGRLDKGGRRKKR